MTGDRIVHFSNSTNECVLENEEKECVLENEEKTQ